MPLLYRLYCYPIKELFQVQTFGQQKRYYTEVSLLACTFLTSDKYARNLLSRGSGDKEIFENVKTVASLCDNFVEQLRLFQKNKRIYEKLGRMEYK